MIVAIIINKLRYRQAGSNIEPPPAPGDYYRQHAPTYGVATYQGYSQPSGTNDFLMQQQQSDSFAAFGMQQGFLFSLHYEMR